VPLCREDLPDGLKESGLPMYYFIDFYFLYKTNDKK
jgi:hypothetical protein